MMNKTTDAFFSREAWDQNARVYETIRTMPFNSELAAGSLSEARFKHYITQDAHYLIGFGRALAVMAAKAPTPDRIVQFAKAAEVAVVVERELHRSFFEQFGITPQLFAETRSRQRVTITFPIFSRRPMRSRTRSCLGRCFPASGSTRRWGATYMPALNDRTHTRPGSILCGRGVPYRRPRHDLGHG
jgi:hypothetical protein